MNLYLGQQFKSNELLMQIFIVVSFEVEIHFNML